MMSSTRCVPSCSLLYASCDYRRTLGIYKKKSVDSDAILRDSIRPVYLQSLILSGKDVCSVGVSSVTQ